VTVEWRPRDPDEVRRAMEHHATRGGRFWHIPMRPRDPDEEHRAATPLELLFDLCFVVAIAFAAAELHHELTANHIAAGLQGYGMVFFAIWWAWMNFTWFASAFDTDDALYRITTFVQMTGVLVLAAGIKDATHGDFELVVIGYVLMRAAMITQWLRVARSDPPRRRCALRYAGGILVVQLFWTLLVLAPEYALPVWIVGALAELAVPVWAERAEPTTWHPHHIAERYGLFTIIVLGESILAATMAMQEAIDAGQASVELVTLAVAGLVIVFTMWWLYFSVPAHQLLTTMRTAFTWGYGHVVIFGSAAAVGAGLQVAVDFDGGDSKLSATAAGMATAVPVAVYVLMVWLLQIRVCAEVHGMVMTVAFPVVAGLVLLTPFTPAPIHVTALLLAVLVTITVVTSRRHTAADLEPGASS
jgi:low temperature requirement protein LtrA